MPSEPASMRQRWRRSGRIAGNTASGRATIIKPFRERKPDWKQNPRYSAFSSKYAALAEN
jgi:hypothetical protein